MSVLKATTTLSDPDQPGRSGDVRCLGKTGSDVSGPSGPSLTHLRHRPALPPYQSARVRRMILVAERGANMRRRELLGVLGGAAATRPGRR
jgi:hypothetical protein